jgi:hypothetical protein
VPRLPCSRARPGEVKWDGATGVYRIIDRAQDTFFVLMESTPSERVRIQARLKKIIYDAFLK